MTLRLRDSQEGKVCADDFGTWYLVLGAAVLLAAFSGDSGHPLYRALAAADEGRHETAAYHYSVALSKGTLGAGDQSIAHNNRGVAYARLG